MYVSCKGGQDSVKGDKCLLCPLLNESPACGYMHTYECIVHVL